MINHHSSNICNNLNNLLMLMISILSTNNCNNQSINKLSFNYQRFHDSKIKLNCKLNPLSNHSFKTSKSIQIRR